MQDRRLKSRSLPFGRNSHADRGNPGSERRRNIQHRAIVIIEATAAADLCCPRCGRRRLHRHGHAHGLQRYRCADCARTFNSLTGTPLARLRYKEKWLPYLDGMLDSHTVRRAAHHVNVHRNTSFRWRHRMLR